LARDSSKASDPSSLSFGFDDIARCESQIEGPTDELFLDAEPRELLIGAQRLELYLSDSGMGWVVRLAALLKEIDYSAFKRAYQPTGVLITHG
jgi:hypothetical protein